MARNKLTPEERSQRQKDAWARRKAREAEQAKEQPPAETPTQAEDDAVTAAIDTPALPAIAPTFTDDHDGHVEGTKPRADLRAKDSGDGKTHVVHFVEDGFTAFGTVWYRGQEVSIREGTPQWNETLDGEGRSWLLFDEFEQEDRYEKVLFRQGPWKGLADEVAITEAKLLDPDLTPEQRARLEKKLARVGQPGGAALLTKK